VAYYPPYRIPLLVATIFLCLTLSSYANAQTATYHIHKEASSTSGLNQLKTAGPDATTVALTSVDLKNLATGEYIIKAFDTQSGVPNVSGVIPASSAVTFTLWLKKTANVGTMFPRAKLNLNSAAGASLCTSTGSTALTTTLTKYTLTCTTAANISMTATDRFYLWVGINLTAGNTSTTFQGSLNLEGTLNGNYDSQIIAPLPIPPPSISSLSVTSGTVGTAVTVTGANFGATQGTSTLTFNGVAATPTSWSTGSIVAPVPANGTTGPVVVSVKGVPSNGITFTVKPKINTLTPTSGAVATSVTIAGTTFGATQGTSTVNFNGTTATPSSWSATSIVAPVPASATTGPVVVTVSGQASNGVTFTVPPKINTLTPTSGPVATSVTIAGTTFGATQGTSTVTFNGTSATPSSWSATSIAAPVPASATTGPVVVTVSGQASNGVTFTVTPKINSLTPTSGAMGTSVTIAGTTFGATQGTSTVTFNGTTATPTSWSATSIAVPVPAGATTGPVVVAVSGQASNGVTFTVNSPAPVISGLSPTSGTVAIPVTISGSNFGATQGTSTVTFNGTTATPTSWSATSIALPVPASATTGPVVVTVSGQASNGVTFTVTPKINSLTPTSGATGTSVTIAGTTFGATQGTSTVTFNGTTATPTSWSATSIAVPVPATATTGPVVVTVSGQASNGVTFTVTLPPPAISGLSPTSGTVATPVTISGSNFSAAQGTSTVTFNGTPAAPTSWSATSIAVPVPASATTGPVVVTVSGQASNGVTFTVIASGTIAGTVTRATDASVIAGALVEVLQSGVIKGSAATAANGTYSIPGLVVGTYDVRVSAAWHVSQNLPGVTVTAQTTTTLNFSLNDALGVIYSYDEIGRLVSVSSPDGNLAKYTYDQLGNLLSITRFDSSQVSIVNITPDFGAEGATVTINGTGFSLTASQNTVLFNGLTAPVLSATATQIVTSVPVGATSGPVSVTSPAGSATSSTSFTVNGYLPTISGFSPMSGAAGTAVTITGSNFQPAGPNKILINATATPVGSVTPTSITTNVVSGTGSGPITVSTIYGRAVSTGDFLITPNGFTGADVEVTGHMNVGESRVVTIGTAPHIAILLFESGSRKISLSVSNNTFPGTTYVTINKPDNTFLTTVPVQQGSTGFIDSQFMPMNGYYTILLNPGGNTGSLTLTLNDATEINSGVLTFGGPPVSVTTAAGQNARLTFSGTASQRATLNITNVTWPISFVTILKPDGQTLTSTNLSSSGGVIDIQTLPVSGTYTVLVDPSGEAAGGMSFALSTSAADARLTFNGNIGQRVNVKLSNVSQPDTLSLTAPDSSTLDTISVNSGAGSIFVETLFTVGQYTALVTPQGASTGNFVLTLTGVPSTETASPLDTSFPTSVSVSTPNTNRWLSFNGTIGQKFSLQITNMTISFVDVSVYAPDGTMMVSPTTVWSGPGGGFIDAFTLPLTGPYTVLVDPGDTGTGNLTLTLRNVSDRTATIIANGPTVNIMPAYPLGAFLAPQKPGQNGEVTFTGTQGERIALNAWVKDQFGSAIISILSPSGSTLATQSLGSYFSSPTTYFFEPLILPANGNYTILVDPPASNFASADLTLYDLSSDVTAGISADGQPVLVTLTSPGQNAILSFSATAGQHLNLNISGVTTPSSNIVIKKPDGTTLVSTSVGTSGGSLEMPLVPSTGTYTILVDPAGQYTGSLTFALSQITDVSGSVTAGGAALPLTISSPGQNAKVTFSGTAGHHLSLSISGVTISLSNVSIYKPDGTLLVSPTGIDTSGGTLEILYVPVSGTYTILVDPQGTNTGNMTLTLTRITDVVNTITVGGAAVNVNITTSGQNGQSTFTGTIGQHLKLRMTSVTIPSSYVSIYKPDGTVLGSPLFVNTSGGTIDTSVMPVSGTYTIVVDPQGTSTGSMTLTLSQITDASNTTSLGGPPVTLSMPTALQNGRLTFTGTTGQSISLTISGVTISQSVVSIYNPDWTLLGTPVSIGTNGGFIDTQTLPANGTYTGLVDPLGNNTGNATLRIYQVPADITGSITPGGASVAVSLSTPGQNAKLTFSGTSGQRIGTCITGNTSASMIVKISKSDGTIISNSFIGAGNTALPTLALPMTDTYTISIDPTDGTAASMNVTVTIP
jgi:YD repeat-containing protein